MENIVVYYTIRVQKVSGEPEYLEVADSVERALHLQETLAEEFCVRIQKDGFEFVKDQLRNFELGDSIVEGYVLKNGGKDVAVYNRIPGYVYGHTDTLIATVSILPIKKKIYIPAAPALGNLAITTHSKPVTAAKSVQTALPVDVLPHTINIFSCDLKTFVEKRDGRIQEVGHVMPSFKKYNEEPIVKSVETELSKAFNKIIARRPIVQEHSDDDHSEDEQFGDESLNPDEAGTTEVN